MPLIDFPIEKLHAYQGSSPRPADFDSFWDAGLAEMRGLSADVRFERHPFPVEFAECFDLTFTGVGGSRVYAKYLRPVVDVKPHGAILQFHGYSGNSGDWWDKLGYVARGFSVAALDCRGQGGRSEDLGGTAGTTLRGHIVRGLDGPPENMAFRRIFLDTAQLAKIVMEQPEVDPARVGAMGGSQGGALTLACAALVPEIKLAAPVFPFLSDYQRVWEMDLADAAYEDLKSYFRAFDPRHERETEIFTKLGYIDIQNLSNRIRARVLMATGLMDRICPPSTQFAAFNKITSPKEVRIYPDFGHEGLPGFSDEVYSFFAQNL